MAVPLAGAVMPGCQTPLALSQMFPWADRVGALVELGEVAELAAVRDLADSHPCRWMPEQALAVAAGWGTPGRWFPSMQVREMCLVLSSSAATA